MPRCNSLLSLFLLKSMLFVVLTIFAGLDPMRRAADGPRLIQVSHSGEMISTILGRFLRPRTGRSVPRLVEGSLHRGATHASDRGYLVDGKVADTVSLDFACHD